MFLPFFKKKSDHPRREFLFALEIGYETVKSAIWTVVNDKTQILSFGNSIRCQTDNTDSLIPGCDQTLSDAAQAVDQNGRIQPEKMILGLPSAWVSDDKIDGARLHLLRDLTKKLSLQAIGFVVTIQALVKYLHLTEGTPPSAIVIGIWQAVIEITLVHLGKIVGTQLVKRSGKISLDVVEGLSRFGRQDMLPSRILIYDTGANLENTRQELLAFPWQAPQNRLNFMHFPKVEILPADFSVKAISLSGGSEVAVAMGLITPDPRVSETPLVGENADLAPGDLGFVAGGDIAVLPAAAAPEIIATPVARADETPVEETSHPPPRFHFPKFKLPSFHLFLPETSFSAKIILGIVFLVLIAGGLFAAYWYLPRATVVISVTPKNLADSFDVTADTTAAGPDLNARVLPAKTASTTVSGSQSKSTTGTKLVGDRATGTVSVINGTPADRTFPQGTVISASGLKFSFNSPVTVPAASGSADPSSYQPGKADVNVTAQAIGVESNLSAGSAFTIGTFSTMDYVAKNNTAFSGGTSRQVSAVAAQDLTDLRSQLISSLTGQVKNQLASSVSSDRQLVVDSVQTGVITEKFDHAVGDVADSLNLSLTLKASGLSFADVDLNNLISARTQALIPGGYETEGEVSHNFSVKSVKNNQAVITVQISSQLTPILANDQIIKNITGKSVSAAKTYLENISGVSRIDFKFTPPLPSGILTLPHQSKNIGVVIKTAQ